MSLSGVTFKVLCINELHKVNFILVDYNITIIPTGVMFGFSLQVLF